MSSYLFRYYKLYLRSHAVQVISDTVISIANHCLLFNLPIAFSYVVIFVPSFTVVITQARFNAYWLRSHFSG